MSKTDPPAVLARQAALAHDTQVQYWIVLSGQDADALLHGTVPEAVRDQAMQHLKRDRAESAEEYALRMEEITHDAADHPPA